MQYLEVLTGKNFVITGIITSLMFLIFITDLQVTTEIYIGGLYVVVIMLSLWLPNSRYTFLYAIASTILACVGYFYSIYNIDPRTYLSTENFVNLSMTVSAIWITTLIAIYIRAVTRAIKRSETMHKIILDSSIDPIIIISTDGVIDSASRAIERTFGWSVDELVGKSIDQILGEEYQEKFLKLFQENKNILHSNLIGNIQEIVGKHRLRREFPCEISINYIDIPELNQQFYTAVLRDISIRKTAEEKMDWLLFHDELTCIYNRRYFNEQLNREWKRLLRSQESLSIIILDVDFFKNYNDSLGHQTGDNCLKMIATALQACMRRSTDFVARYGGEEFVVLLPTTNLEGAERVANNLLAAIANLTIPHPSSKVSKKVSASIGVAAIIPSIGCSPERLIRFADQALYEAKETGRNKFCSYKE